MAKFEVSEHVTTPTGALRVVTDIYHANPNAENTWDHVDHFVTRSLRNGKPFGPTRSYTEDQLKMAEGDL